MSTLKVRNLVCRHLRHAGANKRTAHLRLGNEPVVVSENRRVGLGHFLPTLEW
jgi:hypothetical protein